MALLQLLLYILFLPTHDVWKVLCLGCRSFVLGTLVMPLQFLWRFVPLCQRLSDESGFHVIVAKKSAEFADSSTRRPGINQPRVGQKPVVLESFVLAMIYVAWEAEVQRQCPS